MPREDFYVFNCQIPANCQTSDFNKELMQILAQGLDVNEFFSRQVKKL